MGKLTKSARIGATIFRPGVDERLVIERAIREYEYRAHETDRRIEQVLPDVADWIGVARG